jgi:hypothetical protein
VETTNNGVKSLTEVEVVAKAERRRFTAQYKQKVLREADHCKQPGGDRRTTAAGGIVLVESGELAQAARARGAGRVVNEEARA